MSKTYVSAADRRLVRERAEYRCEYCLLHEADVDIRHEIDHVIAEKHGGQTEPDNLAHACFSCNSYKGSDLASLDYEGVITRLFNPRIDLWTEHFRLDGATITPMTSIGEATCRILVLNRPGRRRSRRFLQMVGRYPTSL